MHGAVHADPDIRVLTRFCGHQDDAGLAKREATALLNAGADVLFTMLNSGRVGAVSACRDMGCKQIGNVDDWTVREPDVFIGSACADVGMSMRRAMEDMRSKRFPAGHIRTIGLETAGAVSLALGEGVPSAVRARLDDARAAIASGALVVPVEWSGEEFAGPN